MGKYLSFSSEAAILLAHMVLRWAQSDTNIMLVVYSFVCLVIPFHTVSSEVRSSLGRMIKSVGGSFTRAACSFASLRICLAYNEGEASHVSRLSSKPSLVDGFLHAYHCNVRG